MGAKCMAMMQCLGTCNMPEYRYKEIEDTILNTYIWMWDQRLVEKFLLLLDLFIRGNAK